MITLNERIKLELRHRDPIEITELILDSSKATDIEGLTSEYKNLRHLSLVSVGLMSLKNWPCLPSLEKLDLSDNRISCGLENLKSCTKLNQLYLAGNKFRSLDEIKSLSQLPCLETLDLSCRTLSRTENYRRKIFEMLPNLKCLDNCLDGESDNEDCDNDGYTQLSDTDEIDEDDGLENHSAKHTLASGKRGKFKSKVNYINQDDEYDDQSAISEFYTEDFQKNPDLYIYESTNINYLDDYAENDEEYEDDTDDDYTPPSYGSKFAPTKSNEDNHRSLKRSYCYSDDYETSTKLYCEDNISCDSYSPIGAGLD